MRLLPELEAYRERLVERCAAWPDTPEPQLLADLHRCGEQIALLEKGIAELSSKLPRAGDGGSGEEGERLAHRIAVQGQMRDLTAAYAEVLRRHLDRHSS